MFPAPDTLIKHVELHRYMVVSQDCSRVQTNYSIPKTTP